MHKEKKEFPRQEAMKTLESGGRELNPLPSPWQGDILPVNYRRIMGTIIAYFNTHENIIV